MQQRLYVAAYRAKDYHRQSLEINDLSTRPKPPRPLKTNRQPRERSVDGRTAKGLRIRAEMRERILAAYMSLMHDGVATPTAREIAKRAKLSVRVIFKHFTDLTMLRQTVIERIPAISQTFFSQGPRANVSADEGLRNFIEHQTAMFEVIAPFRRAASMVEYNDPFVSAIMRQVRDAAVKDLANAIGPELKRLPLGQRRELLTILHVLCSWPSWEALRSHHGLMPPVARRIMLRGASAILHDAFKAR